MKHLTTEVKIQLLTSALTDFQNNAEFTEFGLCNYFYKKHGFNIHTSLEDVFPEVHQKRVTRNAYPWTEHYWFRTKQERIEALKETIEQLIKQN